MFNATLRNKFSALLEAGAAVVVWHYFPSDWPHLDTHDDRFNMRVRKNARYTGIFELSENITFYKSIIADIQHALFCRSIANPAFPVDYIIKGT